MAFKRKQKTPKKIVKKQEVTSDIPDNQDDIEIAPLVTHTLDTVQEIIPDEPVQDRMIRSKNKPCPECSNYPNICMYRRKGYEKFRCRACGHIWES